VEKFSISQYNAPAGNLLIFLSATGLISNLSAAAAEGESNTPDIAETASKHASTSKHAKLNRLFISLLQSRLEVFGARRILCRAFEAGYAFYASIFKNRRKRAMMHEGG
jgi:hypothetical protein